MFLNKTIIVQQKYAHWNANTLPHLADAGSDELIRFGISLIIVIFINNNWVLLL